MCNLQTISRVFLHPTRWTFLFSVLNVVFFKTVHGDCCASVIDITDSCSCSRKYVTASRVIDTSQSASCGPIISSFLSDIPQVLKLRGTSVLPYSPLFAGNTKGRGSIEETTTVKFFVGCQKDPKDDAAVNWNSF